MPKEGYKTITIRTEVFDELKTFADKRYLTVPKAIQYLIDHRTVNPTSSAKEVKP